MVSSDDLPGGAFILEPGGGLVRVRRESFPTEDEFQRLIAEHSDLLAGDLITPEQPRRWTLVDREVGIANGEAGGDYFAVDHLFLDQDGTPTFVEVKRRSDSRLKRDVVAQVLGYVAFATAYLSGDRVKDLWESRLRDKGRDPDTVLSEFLDPGKDPAEFWEDVSRKMRASEVRALIVADEIPAELRRVLEFVNQHMDMVELLGVELQLYATEKYRTLIPRLVGQTAEAEDRKRRRYARHPWTIPEVRESVMSSDEPGLVEALDRLIRWGRTEPRIHMDCGTGVTQGSIHFRVQVESGWCPILQLYTDQARGLLANLPMQVMAQKLGPYQDVVARRELLEQIKESVDPDINLENTDRYPGFSFGSDSDGRNVQRVMDTVLDRIHPPG